jgi:aspartyl-tRNA(Asn)/glutamyl-tRNA(Gln) amidotransferase subunit C
MELTPELVDKLARLSRLEFNTEEKEAIRVDLERMIGLVEKLNELPLEGVKPLLHMTATVNAWRTDEVRDMTSREAAFRNAPAQNGSFFLVPKVIKMPGENGDA